jgi:hypothetical protein
VAELRLAFDERAGSESDLHLSDQLLHLVRESREGREAPRKPLRAASWRSLHAVGAQNAFVAAFHSRRRWAMSWARSSALPPSSTWRSEGSARR